VKTVHFEFDLTDEEADDVAGIFRDAYLHAEDSSRSADVEPAARAWWGTRAEHLRKLADHVVRSSSRIESPERLCLRSARCLRSRRAASNVPVRDAGVRRA
jgi:hypothetical protein